MDYPHTPPYSGPDTPESIKPGMDATDLNIATPNSMSSTSSKSATHAQTFRIPKDLTQAAVDADPQLQRFQRDLLILTSMNENETLHWRPSWFNQEPFSKNFWTLHNPPNIVTERISHTYRGRQCFTRRMRKTDDAPPLYIKTWDHWGRYCDKYGVPHDFLSEEQIELMRLGLPRDAEGYICGKHSPNIHCTHIIVVINISSSTNTPALPRTPTNRPRPLHTRPINLRHPLTQEVPPHQPRRQHPF